MGFELVGKVWDAVSFREYVKKVDLSWANSVTVHHTASPDLTMRRKGWTIQHMRNLEDYYKNKLGWSAAPHLFTDEDEAYGMSSLYRRGVHAVSFNRDSLAIEMLGNYDSENPNTGRGLSVVENTAKFVAILLEKMKLPVNSETVKFHRDDPKTAKTCPGKLLEKKDFLELVLLHSNSDATPHTKTTEEIIHSLEFRLNRIEMELGLT